MVRAVKPSPRDSPVGFGSRSRTITCTPASRSSPASIRPAGPAPTTITSDSIDTSGLRLGIRNTNGETPPGAGSRLVSMERPARFRFIVVDLSWVLHAGWKEPLSEGAGRYDQCRSVCRSDPLGVGHE